MIREYNDKIMMPISLLVSCYLRCNINRLKIPCAGGVVDVCGKGKGVVDDIFDDTVDTFVEYLDVVPSPFSEIKMDHIDF